PAGSERKEETYERTDRRCRFLLAHRRAVCPPGHLAVVPVRAPERPLTLPRGGDRAAAGRARGAAAPRGGARSGGAGPCARPGCPGPGSRAVRRAASAAGAAPRLARAGVQAAGLGRAAPQPVRVPGQEAAADVL